MGQLEGANGARLRFMGDIRGHNGVYSGHREPIGNQMSSIGSIQCL